MRIISLGDGFVHTQSRKDVTDNDQLHVTQGGKKSSDMVAHMTRMTLRNKVAEIEKQSVERKRWTNCRIQI